MGLIQSYAHSEQSFVSKTTRVVELDAHNSSAKCIASSYIIIDRLLAVGKGSSVMLLSLDDLALNYF